MVTQDTLRIVNYAVDILGIMGIAGLSVYALAYLHKSPFQHKINSREELEKIVICEAMKLPVDLSKVEIRYGGTVTGVVRQSDGSTLMRIADDDFATLPIVRHELAHIYFGDQNRKHSKIHYLLVQEPRATLYGMLGIKL